MLVTNVNLYSAITFLCFCVCRNLLQAIYHCILWGLFSPVTAFGARRNKGADAFFSETVHVLAKAINGRVPKTHEYILVYFLCILKTPSSYLFSTHCTRNSNTVNIAWKLRI